MENLQGAKNGLNPFLDHIAEMRTLGEYERQQKQLEEERKKPVIAQA
jgi:hypothetical protein